MQACGVCEKKSSSGKDQCHGVSEETGRSVWPDRVTGLVPVEPGRRRVGALSLLGSHWRVLSEE